MSDLGKRLSACSPPVETRLCPERTAKPRNAQYQVGSLVRFVAVGLVSTGAYFTFVLFLRRYMQLSVTMAGAISFLIVVAFSYVLHYRWTFRSSRAHASAIPRFIGTTVGGQIINSCTLAIGSTRLPVVELLLVASVLVATWNFLSSRLWVFRDESFK